MEASPDGRLIAWAADDDGSERFKLKVRDLGGGGDIETVTKDAIGWIVWAADGKAFVYTEVNDNWRAYPARLHRLGTPPEADITLYEESDPGFSVGDGRTPARRHKRGRAPCRERGYVAE